MKVVLVLAILIGITACGKVTTYELNNIIKECGGADKVHEILIDGQLVKAYCLDGSKAGEWKE